MFDAEPGSADRSHANARRDRRRESAEWRDARNAAWQTTLLGLGNEVGQVVSMTHPDIPGLHGTCNVTGTTVTWASGDAFDTSMQEQEAMTNGVTGVLITGYTTIPLATRSTFTPASAPANGTGLPFQIITMSFRIQRWSLKKDWSVQIEAQTVTDPCTTWMSGRSRWTSCPDLCRRSSIRFRSGRRGHRTRCRRRRMTRCFQASGPSIPTRPTRAGRRQHAREPYPDRETAGERVQRHRGGSARNWIDFADRNGRVPAGQRDSTGGHLRNRFERASFGSVEYRHHRAGAAAGGSFTLENITWPAVAGLVSYVLFVGTQDD